MGEMDQHSSANVNMLMKIVRLSNFYDSELNLNFKMESQHPFDIFDLTELMKIFRLIVHFHFIFPRIFEDFKLNLEIMKSDGTALGRPRTWNMHDFQLMHRPDLKYQIICDQMKVGCQFEKTSSTHLNC
jgi:hypothetical protein